VKNCVQKNGVQNGTCEKGTRLYGLSEKPIGPVCATCRAEADSNFVARDIHAGDRWILVVYCKNCGAVQGISRY